jgi:hypothetical protein
LEVPAGQYFTPWTITCLLAPSCLSLLVRCLLTSVSSFC